MAQNDALGLTAGNKAGMGLVLASAAPGSRLWWVVDPGSLKRQWCHSAP